MSFRNRSKNFTKKNSKLLLIFFLSALLIGGGIFVIRTSAQTTSVTNFTGCLDTNKGDFYSFNLGNTPLKTCKNGDTQVNWNNAVYSAGQGLFLNGNQFSVADQGITTAKIADNSVTGNKIVNVTRVITANIMAQNWGFGARLNSTGFTEAIYTFAIPYDYVGGDLTVREWFRWHDNVGVAKMTRPIDKLPNGGGQTILISTNNADLLTTADNGFPSRTYTIPSASVNRGEIFYAALQREGDLPDDTSGRLDLIGVAVEYPADQ